MTGVATARQRRRLADLTGLDPSLLPADLSEAAARRWLKDLRLDAAARPAAPVHVLDGLWVPHPPGFLGSDGLFFWAADQQWYAVPAPPRRLEIGESDYYRPIETRDRTRVHVTDWAENPSPRNFPGGQWAQRRPIATIAPARLALWREQRIVHTTVYRNRRGLPEVVGDRAG